MRTIADPTSLIIKDEADRLTMNSLEQLRSIFNASGLGMVLIGIPCIQKRISRYPQFTVDLSQEGDLQCFALSGEVVEAR